LLETVASMVSLRTLSNGHVYLITTDGYEANFSVPGWLLDRLVPPHRSDG
jgi:hypothetical protein